MTNKYYIVILIVFLGFVLIPNSASACGSSSNKSCCSNRTSKAAPSNFKKESCCSTKEANATKTTNEKSCCSQKTEHSKDTKACNGKCGGNCGHKSCKCSVINLVAAYFKVNATNHNKLSLRKHIFPPIESYLSPGFYSIWTPPNIV